MSKKHPPLLSLSHVEKSFRISGKHVPILKNISLDLQQGEWIGLMGNSGSGKTTLLSLIAGIIRPDHGEVFWKGKKLWYFFDIYPAFLRNREMGFIFQDFRLVEEESVWENLLLPLRIKGWYGKEELQRALWLLERVGLQDHRSHPSGLLSGGQKQRLALARALVLRPSLVLADEPFANLDEHTAEEMMELFLSLRKEENFAMILVHHRKKLSNSCDKTYHLENGRLHPV
ncbi:MAG: ABC transporter ATP-binding protein [Brevinematales bacterium]|nr:ABC transporter ATP-binding protein [Brevinematales bacterium]